MPITIYLQSKDELINYNNFDDIPVEYNNDVTSLDAFEMKLTGISRIGKRFPNIENLNVSCNKIKKLDLTNFSNLV
jgi:Leucine-rich repeat (LRR) protein